MEFNDEVAEIRRILWPAFRPDFDPIPDPDPDEPR
jgi:hypothetical protein